MTQTTATIHRSFLVWRRGRYANWAVALCSLCVLLYALDRPTGPPNGGSWLGYTLGVVATALVVWLGWFGIRRRRYGGTELLEDQFSAHVYLGMAVLVVATLHSGFQLHWNVHSLAYGLLVAVVLSGMFGAYAFWRYPALMTRNRGGATLMTMTTELAEIDTKCRAMALAFPDEILALVRDATGSVQPGTTLFRRQRHRARALSRAAIERVQNELIARDTLTPAEILPLVQALAQRLSLTERLYRDHSYRFFLLQWRAIHVPLTVALVAALFVHVLAVFYFW